MAKIAATQSESDNSSPGVDGDKVKHTLLFLYQLIYHLLPLIFRLFQFQDGVGTTVQTTTVTSSMPISISDILNSVGEPTYRPSSEKISMSEINQPILGELETSPPKTTTQHSHTNGSDHEATSGEEDQVVVNKDTMVVDEEVQAGDNPEDGSPNVEGTIDTNQEGKDGKNMVMEEEDEGNQTPLNVGHERSDGDDDGGSEEEDNNGEGNQDTVEGQTQSQTLTTPTVVAIPEGRVSIGSTGVFSSEELAILKRNQPLEYLKVMLSSRERSFEKILSTTTTSND